MSDFNTQTTENQQVTPCGSVLQNLINSARANDFDYRIEEVTSWNEEYKYNQTEVFFRFRQDGKKNSMIWFEFVGNGSAQDVKMMFFNMRYNGANGHVIKSWNQEYKSRQLLGIDFKQLFA